MATNLYGKSCTPNLGGVQDFYTKAEVNQLLTAKANISTTYTRAYIDDGLSALANNISSLGSEKISQVQLDLALETLQGTIESDTSNTYATLLNTYTKDEVNTLIANIDLNPSSYIRTSPTSTLQNTIHPGAANAVALTVRGSSTNPTVTQWLDDSGNIIGSINNTGGTMLNGTLSVGQLVPTSDVAINVNNHRITGVVAPVSGSDAVPFSTLQSYILQFYEEALQTEAEAFYSLDAGVY